MRPVDIHTEAASIRLSPSPTITTASIEVSRRAPSYIWARIGAQPATAFVFLSLAFGSLIIFVLQPLRGRDLSFLAHLLLRTRGASTRRRGRRPQGNLRRARAVRSAPFLHVRRGMVRHVRRKGRSLRADHGSIPRLREYL